MEVLGCSGYLEFGHCVRGRTHKVQRMDKRDRQIRLVNGAQEETRKLIVFQAGKGPVSDFIDRFFRERPRATSRELKFELSNRFAEIVDRQHALTQLRRIKQKPKESVQIFAERLLTLS